MLLRLTLSANHVQEVRDPRDTQVPQQLAKAYRLHARARVPSPADLASNVRTLLRTGAAQPVVLDAAACRLSRCLQPPFMLGSSRCCPCPWQQLLASTIRLRLGSRLRRHSAKM